MQTFLNNIGGSMRTQILKYIEKKSKVDLGELAILLGTDEVTVANEIAQMEKEKIICGVTRTSIRAVIDSTPALSQSINV